VSLSGGELRKLALLHLVASEPDALLLDEPTNHLDARGIEWVEEHIAAFAGPVLVVSHDRALLDACADRIVELEMERPATVGSVRAGSVEVFRGNYSDYADERARREAELWERYERQQREERRLKRVVSAIESRSRNIEQRTINFHYRKRAAKVARRAVTLKARMEREAASADHVDRPAKPNGGFRGEFATTDAVSSGAPYGRGGGAPRLVSALNVALEVAGRRLVNEATFELRRGDRTVLMGANGSGKTTLLRAILGEHPLAEGELSVHPAAQPGYLPQEDASDSGAGESRLTALDLVRRSAAISEADAHNFLHRFLLGHDQVATPVDRLSYGERRRLALARLVLAGSNLLLLDEPTNHLDIPSREAFEGALVSYDGAAFIVTHDRYFIEQYADIVLELANGRLRRVA
jgi:ATPase subunit of ABC transporter with duplicated ATPase domains